MNVLNQHSGMNLSIKYLADRHMPSTANAPIGLASTASDHGSIRKD